MTDDGSTIITTTQGDSTSPNSKKILVVDDDRDIAEFFRIALERAGFKVDVFNDPLLSLTSYKTRVYDLLLLDIRMPHMSGFELYCKIHNIDDRVKVCFVTAFEEYYDEFRKMFAYPDELECYIRKPIGMQDLTRIVETRLNGN